VRILHVETGRHLYGGPRQVLYLLEGLAGRGIDNVLVCPRDSAIAAEAAVWAEVFAVPARGDLDVTLIPRVWRAALTMRADLVHLHSRRGADVMGGIAGRMLRRPVVLSRRVDNPETPRQVRLKYRLYDRVIAISGAIERVLLKCGVPRAKLRMVPSAVDCRRFDAPLERQRFLDALGLAPGTRCIGVVAQLIPRKGHADLLSVWPSIQAEHPETRLILFGRGPLEAELKSHAARLGSARTVIFAGFREDLPRLLPNLDLLVHPARQEGLGVAVLEAACAGVPIVATAAGGITEIIRHGENGALAPPGNRRALAQAVLQLLAAPRLARQLAEQARRDVETRYSVAAMVAGNLAVYEELLKPEARAV
jgi:glycosyltransferase involved in cell wall biosynthesis